MRCSWCIVWLCAIAFSHAQRICSNKLPTNPIFVPPLSNGFMGTIAAQPVLHVAGLFNGRGSETPSHRADLVSAICVVVSDAAVHLTCMDYGLGTLEQTFITTTNVTVTQLSFAPRTLSSGLLTRFNATGPFSLRPCDASSLATDVQLAPFEGPSNSVALFGSTLISEAPTGATTQLATIYSVVPSTTVPAGTLLWLKQVVRTSNDASDVREAALQSWQDASDPDLLLVKHQAAWASLWSHSITSDNSKLNLALAASQYQIWCNLREDVVFSSSPGGIGEEGVSLFACAQIFNVVPKGQTVTTAIRFGTWKLGYIPRFYYYNRHYQR
jgi:hypothetical protein